MYCIFGGGGNCVVVTECHWKQVAGLSRWVEKDQRETESEVGNLCGLIYCNYWWHLTVVVGFCGRAASHAFKRMFAEIRKLIVNIFPASSLMLGIITPRHPQLSTPCSQGNTRNHFNRPHSSLLIYISRACPKFCLLWILEKETYKNLVFFQKPTAGGLWKPGNATHFSLPVVSSPLFHVSGRWEVSKGRPASKPWNSSMESPPLAWVQFTVGLIGSDLKF